MEVSDVVEVEVAEEEWIEVEDFDVRGIPQIDSPTYIFEADTDEGSVVVDDTDDDEDVVVVDDEDDDTYSESGTETEPEEPSEAQDEPALPQQPGPLLLQLAGSPQEGSSTSGARPDPQDEPPLPQLPGSPQEGSSTSGARPDHQEEVRDPAAAPTSGPDSIPGPGSQTTDRSQDASQELSPREGVEAAAMPPPRSPQVPTIPAGLARRQGTLNESISEFRSPKRRKRSSPEKKEPAVESDDDSDCCPICFEPWTTSGNHRLASLRCGHLFGQSCIDKWLKGQGGKCPQCNAKAKRQDIRVLYTKTIKAVDTTERDRALADLEKEKENRRKAEMEAAHTRLQYQLSVEECNRLRQELNTTRTQLQQLKLQMSSCQSMSQRLSQEGAGPSSQGNTGRFFIDKSVKIWEAGQCRVLAYSPSLAALIVSQPSSSTLFPGFGIKKLSAMDFKTSHYITIHSKAIRDMCFHPTVDNGLLLSGGLDKAAKMTSIVSNTVVQTYHTPVPIWSCVWNTDDQNYFYTGLMNGTVLEYDVRNTQSHVQQLNTGGSKSPVVSMQYIPKDHNAAFRPGGLVVGQLDRTSFFERKGEQEPRLNYLPLEGSLTSLNFDHHTRHLLASFRPTAKHPSVRHQLCEMTCTNLSTDPTETDNLCSCNTIHTFHGGKTQLVLSKSALIPSPGDPNRLLVCAGDEASNSIMTWDCSSGAQVQRISTGAHVVDITTFAINNTYFMVALTDKLLKVLKWCS